eukprot:maker-scaffold2255_size18018-snap-gene-0.8 protein:Tk05959 transcript:maker-scaffold2255_size18018-snap-gene-0.8-mRNA-1 annotation:"juvenile hormone esterase"
MTFPVAFKPAFDGSYMKDPLFPLEPERAILEGKTLNVPLMIGFNKDEGLHALSFMLKNPDHFSTFRDNWDQCIAINAFGKHHGDVSSNDIELAQKLSAIYFPGKDDRKFSLESSIPNFRDFFTDTTFSFSVDLSARSIAQQSNSKVFYYYLQHHGQTSLQDVFESYIPDLVGRILFSILGVYSFKRRGVCHADDLIYLFKIGLPIDLVSDPDDLAMSRKMVDLWTNFATYRHPTPMTKDGSFIGPSLANLTSPWKSVAKQLEAQKPLYYTLDTKAFGHEAHTDLEARLDFWPETSMARDRSKSRERTPPHLPSLDVEANGNHSASLRGSHHNRVPDIPNHPLNILLPELANGEEHPCPYFVTQNVVMKIPDGQKPPWMAAQKSSERGVYDHFKSSNHFQERIIQEFIKDALFLEVSGLCSSALTESTAANEEEGKINGWLENHVVSDEVYHQCEKLVWESIWDEARKLEQDDLPELEEIYAQEPPDEDMMKILVKNYSSPLSPSRGKSILVKPCGEIIYHLNKLMQKGSLKENYAIQRLQELVITQVAGKVVLDEALKFMEDHMAYIDEEEKMDNPPRSIA